jgi:hypothetical protein
VLEQVGTGLVREAIRHSGGIKLKQFARRVRYVI